MFRYEPLADPLNEIRLLKLVPVACSGELVSPTTEVQCHLSTQRLDETPKYIAVSYTWGSPLDEREIQVNGEVLLVRHSCWFLLHQALLDHVSEHLWIDAICINQRDDDEKSRQVTIMGDIYRCALQVNICLGPHADDSAFVFAMAQQHSAVADSTLMHSRESNTLAELLDSTTTGAQIGPTDQYNVLSMDLFDRSVRAKLLHDLDTRRLFSQLSTERLRRLTDALYALSEREYFKRLWIVQEVLLSRSTKVVCGNCAVDFQRLVDFEFDLGLYGGEQRGEQYASIDFTTSAAFNSLINFMHAWDGTGTELMQLTDIFADSRCADVRDRIYGLLGLVDWRGYDQMRPDYTKTASQIALQTISYMCPKRPNDSALVQRDSSEGETAKDDDSAWPIVSATRIAVALELHGENAEIAALLRYRRSELSEDPSRAYDRPSDTEGKVVVAADAYCEIFAGENGANTFSACLGRSDSPVDGSDLELPPGYEREQHVDPGDNTPSETVSNGTISCAKVPKRACPGDLLLLFTLSGINVGLVVRRLSNTAGRHKIVGQVVFDEGVRVCAGSTSCCCSLEDGMHPQKTTGMVVRFDPEDLLLFACQTMRIATVGERVLDLSVWNAALSGQRLREAYTTTRVGTIEEDGDTQALRLVTPVVKSDDPLSSYAETTEVESARWHFNASS